jgi:hypothetical protein
MYKLQNAEGMPRTFEKQVSPLKSLSQVTMKPTDSLFWKGLMKIKEEFLNMGSFTMGNGEDTRF